MTIEAMCQQEDKGSETTVNNRQQDLQLQHNTNIEQQGPSGQTTKSGYENISTSFEHNFDL